MNWQGFWIFLYLAGTIWIGVYAAKRVKNAKDFILAGRSLPLPISTAALFATWFGSETILGSSVEFAKYGFMGVIQDPLGAALCLFLLGAVFARPLYKMQILTFGDFYRKKKKKRMEFISGVCLILSYFGWIAAQFVALGILFQLIFGLPQWIGISAGALLVVFYTYLGGMWSVSLTDFVQSISIVIGLIAVFYFIQDELPILSIIEKAPPTFFQILPEHTPNSYVHYISAWIVIGLGSIPQQDLFQRVMSAKSEKVAVQAALLSSLLYLVFSMIPLFLGLSAMIAFPDFSLEGENSQMLIPMLVQNKTPEWIQILFFSALFSAILSSASGAILAPSSILSENILKHLWKDESKVSLLNLSRYSVLVVSIVSYFLAIGKPSIYALVEDSSGISLVTLFVPLVFGLYSKRVSESAGIFSLVLGLVTWIGLEFLADDQTSHFYGTVVSFFGILVGMFLFPKSSLEQPIK